jgi:hypothetical protein
MFNTTEKSPFCKEADLNRLFMDEFVKGPSPITKRELRELIRKRPAVYGRFSVFLQTNTLKD